MTGVMTGTVTGPRPGGSTGSTTGAVMGGQVVVLGVADEILAVDAGLVREIIEPIPVTRVASARPHLAGVINVRGNVVPLADIRLRFGLEVRPDTPDTRIVVIELEIDGDPVVVALLADKVHAVTQLDEGDTQAIPRVGLRWKPEFIRSISTWNERFIIVPDLERVLN